MDSQDAPPTTGDWPAGSALLLTRASPRAAISDDFDAWQRATHLPDLLAAPGTRSVFYGMAYGDLSALTASSSQAGRIAIYASANLDRLITFIGSREVERAIADGSQWFGNFDPLDGEPYSGNAYLVDFSWGATEQTTQLEELSALVVARLEVPPDRLEDFDSSLHGDIAPTIAEDPIASGVRACLAHREDIPVSYYYSPGNRAVLVSVAPATERQAVEGLVYRMRLLLAPWQAVATSSTLEVFTPDTILRGTTP